MAERKLILSEVLLIIQNKYGTIPFTTIQNIIVNFFSDDEIVCSKRKLYDVTISLYGEEIGCHVTRKEDNNENWMWLIC